MSVVTTRSIIPMCAPLSLVTGIIGTDIPVVALRIVGRVDTPVSVFVTRIGRASDPVAAIPGGSGADAVGTGVVDRTVFVVVTGIRIIFTNAASVLATFCRANIAVVHAIGVARAGLHGTLTGVAVTNLSFGRTRITRRLALLRIALEGVAAGRR